MKKHSVGDRQYYVQHSGNSLDLMKPEVNENPMGFYDAIPKQEIIDSSMPHSSPVRTEEKTEFYFFLFLEEGFFSLLRLNIICTF